MRHTLSLTIKIIFIAGLIFALLYVIFFNPEQFPAPKCIFHTLTGYDCPGCGTQRALHALGHGDIAGAWKYNPAVFAALPLMGLYAIDPPRLQKYTHSVWAPVLIASAIVAWWIIRNI